MTVGPDIACARSLPAALSSELRSLVRKASQRNDGQWPRRLEGERHGSRRRCERRLIQESSDLTFGEIVMLPAPKFVPRSLVKKRTLQLFIGGVGHCDASANTCSYFAVDPASLYKRACRNTRLGYENTILPE